MVSAKNLVLVFLAKFKISKNWMIDTNFVTHERLIHSFLLLSVRFKINHCNILLLISKTSGERVEHALVSLDMHFPLKYRDIYLGKQNYI